MNIRNRPFRDVINDRLNGQLTGGGVTVVNAEGPRATVRIYEEIGFWGVTAEAFSRILDEITAPEIEVQIASLGGDVFDGIAIYNALRAHPAKIITRVDSMAASIASVIAQAGEHRIMLSGSQMMIHEAWGLAIGTAADMRQLADILDKQNEIIADIYAENGSGSAEEFLAKMTAETWMTADETVAAGLADEVISLSDRPADRWHKERFTDQLEAAVAAVEKVAEETENVVTFRSSQGKPPLSDEAERLVEQLRDALSRLTDAVEPENEPQDQPQPADPVEQSVVSEWDRRRFEWEGRKHERGSS